MTNFTITATSDTVCPWCYVGRKHLQAAEKLWKERYPDSNDTFTVSYLPFQLNPQFPKGPASSTSKQEYYLNKFGKDRSQMIFSSLSSAGKAVGIDFKFGGQTGNSRDSHRLVRLSKKYGNEVESKLLDKLYNAFFENEQDITSYDTLRKIAVEAGIPEADFQSAIIDSDEGGREVDDAANQARLNGVTGVPDYVLQDRYRLQGASNPESFVRAFERIKAEETN
ncbi:thioredoxin-like protein [Mariannaea sp. PMI_226]|nr:thioredoxin-like protein [Mariannaea sp. PMI_226]